jgi:hypothetical protein
VSLDAPAPDADILSDLSTIERRPPGNPCGVAVMRRDRPDLIPHWERVLEAKRTGATRATADDIAAWFEARDFPVDPQLVSRHMKAKRCAWCRSGRVA